MSYALINHWYFHQILLKNVKNNLSSSIKAVGSNLKKTLTNKLNKKLNLKEP